MKELSEDREARGADGVCGICHCGPKEPHDRRAHDNWWAAQDATYR